jgi:heat shock protein HslJ
MSLVRLPVALVAAAVLSAASAGSTLGADASASSGPIPTDSAEGVTWQLQQQLVEGALAPVPDGVVVTLRLEQGNAGGNGGCNTYTGSYTLDGTALTFGQLASTQMACEEPAMSVESTYLANLALTASWFSDGGSLTLQDADGQSTLVFGPAADVVPVDGIEGITWQLVEYLNGGDGVTPVPEGVVATLVLQGGAAGGSGGCNSFTTDYSLDGSSITFGQVTSTFMFCEGPAGEVETVYFASLPLVADWASDGTRLTLSDAAGAPILVFEPAPSANIEGGWVATGINDGQEAVVATGITPEVTAVFAAGQLSGFDGCNEYSTTYELDGDRNTIAPEIATTRMACPSEEHATQVQQYAAALVAATTWSVDPARGLELRDDAGALQVSYSPAAG